MRSIITLAAFAFLSCLTQLYAQSCTPITIQCPSDITITADPGACGMIHNYVVNMAGDCPLASLTQTDGSGLTSGDEFPIGTTVQSYESADSSGNTDQCSFTITIVEFPNPITDDACNASINLSPDADCEVLVTADMILEGGPYGCYDNYIVSMTTTSGAPVPNPITADFIGQTIIASVLDPSGNSCWGYINYEDYIITPLVCGTHTVNCRNNVEPNIDPIDSIPFPIPDGFVVTPSSGTGPFIVEDYDNCGDINLSYTDQTLELDCTQGGPFTRIVFRHWTATDNQGNTTTCTDTINLRIPELSAANIFPNRNGTDAPSILCSGNWDANQDGIPQPDEIGDELNMNCDVWGEYTDIIHYIPCGAIIDRSWDIVNMCTGELVSFIQQIRLVDDEDPVITCTPNLTGTTNLYDCVATYNVPAPQIEDECSTVTYTVSSSAGVVTNIGSADHPHYVINGLDIGMYTLTFTAVDGCGNTATCTSQLTIVDAVPPHANCENNLTIYLGSDDEVDVNDLNVYSSDGCGIDYMKLRRVLQGNCDGTSYDDLQWHDVETFCCEEAGQTILVELGIWDIYGNFSSCISHIFVESNVAPSLTCPPDITVSCSYDFDENDLSIFGTIVQGLTDAENIVIDDEDYIVYCKGQTYQGPRVWGQDGVALSECAIDIRVEETFNTECGRSIFENGMYLPAITREFIISNASGDINSCTQNIYILDCNPQATDIDWPADVVIDACVGGSSDPSETGFPVVSASSCDEISTRYEDEDGVANGDTCRVIIRHWTAVSDCASGSDSIVGEYDQNIFVIKSTPILLEGCIDTFQTVSSFAGENRIFNGDFELGDVGFTSEYGQFPSAAGGYVVDVDPSVYNPDHGGVDHTSGVGNMMIVDGSRTAGEKVWCQEVAVSGGSEFQIGAWVNNLIIPTDNFADPVIEFVITTYSEVLINTGAIPESPDEWINYQTTWTAPESRTVEFCIWSTATAGIGNDFAIDDISFARLGTGCALNPDNLCEQMVNVVPPEIIDCDSMAVLNWVIEYDDELMLPDLIGNGELPDSYPFGEHVVTWSASDMCGNETTCQSIIISEDCEPPILVCEDIELQIIQDTNGIVITADQIAGGSFDNCGDVTAQFLICDENTSSSLGALVMYAMVFDTMVTIDISNGNILTKTAIEHTGIKQYGSLTYSPNDDRLYAIQSGDMSWIDEPHVLQFNRKGELIERLPIQAPAGMSISGVESFYYNKSRDVFYLSANTNGDSSPLTPSLLAVDVTTGETEFVASINGTIGSPDLDRLVSVGDKVFCHDFRVGVGYDFYEFDLNSISGNSVTVTPLFGLDVMALSDCDILNNKLYYQNEGNLVTVDLTSGEFNVIGEMYTADDFGGSRLIAMALAPALTPDSCTLVDDITVTCDDFFNSVIKTFEYDVVVTDAAGNTDTCSGAFQVADSNEICPKPICELIYAIDVGGAFYSINTQTGAFNLITQVSFPTTTNAVAVNADLGLGYFGTEQEVYWVDLIDGTTGFVGNIGVPGSLSAAAGTFWNGHIFLGPETANMVEDLFRVKLSIDGKSFDGPLVNLTNGSVPTGNFGDMVVLDGGLDTERLILSLNDIGANNIYEYQTSGNTFTLLSTIPSISSSQITIDNLENIWYYDNGTSQLGFLDPYTGVLTDLNVVPITITDMGRSYCPPSAFSSVYVVENTSEVELFQNRPNPFLDETIIDFYLPNDQDVEILIYGMNGEVMHASRFEGRFGMNEYLLRENLASGIYFYQLRTSEGVMTKQMIRM